LSKGCGKNFHEHPISFATDMPIRQTAENALFCYTEESFKKKFSGWDEDANYVQNLIRFSSSKMHVFGKTVTRIRSSINLFIYLLLLLLLLF